MAGGSAAAMALVLTAAMTLAVPAPADVGPLSPDATVAGWVDASPYPVLQRLGRWDGTGLQPVAPASVDADHVVVVTHGWADGLKKTYDELQAGRDTLVALWDPGMVEPDGVSTMADFGPLLGALQAADPQAAVVMFSWVDQSATGADPLQARRAEAATEVNGHRLAVAVDAALVPGWDGEMHVLGHSFGARVATIGALSLAQAPRQLTLLDSPEVELARLGGAMNDLQYLLPRLTVGRAGGDTFVDSYISLVGARYGTEPGLAPVVDVRLAAPGGSSFRQRHLYPVVWWTSALAAGPSPATGPWWSPLLGGDPGSAPGYSDEQDPDTPTILTALEPAPAADVASALGLGTVPLAPGGFTLEPGGTTRFEITVPTDDRSLLLELDLAWDGPPGATLAMALDGRQRWVGVGPDLGTGGPGQLLTLWDLEPGVHTLAAVLTGAPAGASVTISNLRIATSADIVRGASADETDALVTVAVVIAVILVVGAVVVLALGVRALLRRRRRRRRVRRGP